MKLQAVVEVDVPDDVGETILAQQESQDAAGEVRTFEFTVDMSGTPGDRWTYHASAEYTFRPLAQGSTQRVS